MSTTGSRRFAVGKPRALRALLKPVPTEIDAAIEHVLGVYQTLAGEEFPADTEGLRDRFQLAASRGYTPQGFLRHLAAILSSGSRRHLLEELEMEPENVLFLDDNRLNVNAARARGIQVIEVTEPVAAWTKIEQILGNA